MKFLTDIGRLYKASKLTTLMIVAVEVFLGALVVIELGILSHLIESVLGARSLGIWTSDVLLGLKWQIVVLVIVVFALHAKEQVSGLSAKLGLQIRETVFIISTFLAAIVSAPFGLIILLAGYLLLDKMKKMSLRIGYSIIAIAVAYSALNNLLQMTVARTVDISQMIWWGGALMAFVVFVALKPHLRSK